MSRKTSQAGEAEIGATDRAQRQSLHAHDGAGRAQQQTPEIISENKQTDTFSADKGRLLALYKGFRGQTDGRTPLARTEAGRKRLGTSSTRPIATSPKKAVAL
jgi:hypothetical protein